MQIVTGERKSTGISLLRKGGHGIPVFFLYIVQVKIKSKCPLSVLADGD